MPDLDRRVLDQRLLLRDLALQAGLVLAVPEVEHLEQLLPRHLAVGDLVEIPLEQCREGEVDVVLEVRFEELGHRVGSKGRHQAAVLLEDVATALDRVEDRGVGRGPPDPLGLELLDQRRLGVAGRRARLVVLGVDG